MNSNYSEATNPKTAIVIGGGIIGLATAYALGKEGVRVTVVDEGAPELRASTATAGIIGGSSVIPWASSNLWPRLPAMLWKSDGPLRLVWPFPDGTARFFKHSIKAGRSGARQVSSAGLANLGLRGWDAWQDLLSDLPAARALFVQNKCLFYYTTAEQQEADAENNAVRRGFGMDLTDLNAKDMQALLPPLACSVAAGICVNSAGHVVDPVALQEILGAAIVDQGADLIQQSVTGFARTGDKLTSVIAGKSRLDADAIVVSAGSGSANLAADCGLRIPMIPAWGASVTFADPDIELGTPFLSLDDGIAFTPSRLGLRVSGLLQVGGAGRFQAMKNTLVAQARQFFGDFGFSEIVSCTGARPLTPDSVPLLGRDPRHKNVFYNFGHGHWGLTQAAISALVTKDILLGRESGIDISGYRPDRF